MPDFPKITVITACLNAARTIETTIKSVLDQNYPNLEYIIIDGVSTDGTLDIVEKYKDRITKIVSEPDKGIYDAFNKGIALATGDLIGILNADDFYAPWALNVVAESVEFFPEYGVFWGNLLFIDPTAKKWFLPHFETNLKDTFHYRMTVWHPSSFVTKKTYDAHGVYSLKYSIASDWDCLLRFYKEGVKFYPIDIVMAAFRLGGTSDREMLRTIHEMSALSREHGTDESKMDAYCKNLLKENKRNSIMRFLGLFPFKYLILNLSGFYEMVGDWTSCMENSIFNLTRI